MKIIVLALTVLTSISAFATHGVDCRDIEGTLEISTNEAAMAGDNLISIYVKAGKKALSFTQVASTGTSDYPNKIYMGSDEKGNSVLLELNTSSREGIDMATVYLKLKDRTVIKETSMLCEN